MNAPAQVRDARPTIVIDGNERPELGRGLLRLAIVEDEGGLYRCEATFANWGEKNRDIGFLHFGRDLMEFGKAFAVRYDDATLFDGRITGLEGNYPEGAAPEITTLVEDRLQDLRMVRRTRSFEQTSDADLFRRVAQDHSLTPDVDVAGPTHRVLAQVNLSDLAFVRERARAIDADVWVDARTLRVKARAGRRPPPFDLVYGSGLRSFRVAADLAHQRTSVRATGWSPDDKRAISEEATDQAVQGELGGDESGASILRAKLGERREVLAHTTPANAQEARARAEAYYRQSARRFVTGEGVAAPNPRIRAGAEVNIQNLGKLFDGRYHIAETCWLFDESGLRVEFRAERPGLGRVT